MTTMRVLFTILALLFATCAPAEGKNALSKLFAKKLQANQQEFTCGLGQKKVVTKFGSIVISRTCEKCPKGKYMDEYEHKHNSCFKCPEGMYQNNRGDTTCKICPVGQYQDEPGAKGNWNYPGSALYFACKTCGVGRFNNVEGRTTPCEKCPAGKYSNHWDSSRCKKCPSATWQDQRGKTGCKSCASGRGTEGYYGDQEEGSTNNTFCKDCSALDGEYYSDTLVEHIQRTSQAGVIWTAYFRECKTCVGALSYAC